MALHLLLRLEGPLMAFGGEAIDNLGVIREFPALSMLTGLIANALGWRREDGAAHDRLQERLVFGARLDQGGTRFTDFQTAELHKDDAGWTTSGKPEGRDGGDGTYKGKHLRYRDYFADAVVTVVLRLEPADESPSLDDVAAALRRPARPLFLGRKPCVPTAPLLQGAIEEQDILAALRGAELRVTPKEDEPIKLMWPVGEGELEGSRCIDVCDERNWTSGVHGGWRGVRVGSLKWGAAA